MRITRKFMAVVCLSFMTAGTLAAAEHEGYLIRTQLVNPTPGEISELIGAPVTKVDLVSEGLYQIEVSDSAQKSLNFNVLKHTVGQKSAGLVSGIQKNFIYTHMLHRPSHLREPVEAPRPTTPDDLAEDDNPAIKPPVAGSPSGPDPKVNNQWGIENVNVKNVWERQKGAKDLIVAVIDTGIDYNHEDLINNMWRNPNEIPGNGIDDDNNGYIDDVVGWDFASDDSLPYDKMSQMRIDGNPGHGTHCAGVVAAVGKNTLGITGVAPNVSIMGIRFIDDKGQGTTANAIKAINYAVANGAKILSNSWGGEQGDEDDEELKVAIQNAQDQGVLMIFAAGNGRNGMGYNNDTDKKPMVPASFDHDAIISVAAIDVNNKLGPFSNYGVNTVDIAAPGVKVLSTVPKNQYEDAISFFGFPLADWSGTSMAAPHVAGAAALLWSETPNASAAEIKARLLESTTPVEELKSKLKTGGILNVEAAFLKE